MLWFRGPARSTWRASRMLHSRSSAATGNQRRRRRQRSTVHGLSRVPAAGAPQVPTFLFVRGGREVLRHVGSSRGDLIGKILEVQSTFGVAPPQPSAPRGAKPRSGKGLTRRERIAERERQQAASGAPTAASRL
jgi:hypothetical protein